MFPNAHLIMLVINIDGCGCLSEMCFACLIIKQIPISFKVYFGLFSKDQTLKKYWCMCVFVQILTSVKEISAGIGKKNHQRLI